MVSAEPFAPVIVARPELASQGRFRAWAQEHLSIRVHDSPALGGEPCARKVCRKNACWVAPWFARVVHSLGLLVSGLCSPAPMNCDMWQACA